MKLKFRIVFLLLFVATSALSFTSCARETTTHATGTTAVTTPVPVTSSSTTVVERETVVEEDNPNIVSRTINIIGDILALPFRLVGGLFELIF